MMKYKNISAAFVLLLLFSIPEYALSDLFLSSQVKKNVLIVLIAALGGYLLYLRKLNYNNFIFALGLNSIVALNELLRIFFVQGADGSNAITSIAHFVIITILLEYSIIFLEKTFVNNYAIRLSLWTLLFLPLLSMVLFSLKQDVFLEQYDNQGHLIKLIYLSFSSSIYQIGDLVFARMNGFFDEPGTLGFFYSMLIGLFLLNSKTTRMKLVTISIFGLASLSLTYILYVISIAIYKIGHSLKLFVMLIVLSLTFALVAPTSTGNNEESFSAYMLGRFISLIDGTNNRSDGNSDSIEIIIKSPLGIGDDKYNEREISSSGILVLIAYKGYLYGFSILMMYFFYILRIQKMFKLGFMDIAPFGLALFLNLLSRNNLFNASGMVIILFAQFAYLYLIRKK
jgi:hypothetical protein